MRKCCTLSLATPHLACTIWGVLLTFLHPFSVHRLVLASDLISCIKHTLTVPDFRKPYHLTGPRALRALLRLAPSVLKSGFL
jgi:hypothetical protein